VSTDINLSCLLKMVSDPSVDLSIDRSMHNSRLIVDTKVKLVQGPFSAESGSSKRNLLGSAIVKQRSPNVSTSPVSDHASTSLLSPPRSLHVMSPNVSFQPSSPSRDDTMRATSEYVIECMTMSHNSQTQHACHFALETSYMYSIGILVVGGMVSLRDEEGGFPAIM